MIRALSTFLFGSPRASKRGWTLSSPFTPLGDTTASETFERSSSRLFYASRAWQVVRYKALKRSKGRCECCGRSPGADGIVLHVDHVLPRSRYPHLALVESNVQVLCEDCNLGKGAWDETDWRMMPQRNYHPS